MENLLSMKCLNEMSLSMKYLIYEMYQRYFFSYMLKIHNTKKLNILAKNKEIYVSKERKFI